MERVSRFETSARYVCNTPGGDANPSRDVAAERPIYGFGRGTFTTGNMLEGASGCLLYPVSAGP